VRNYRTQEAIEEEELRDEDWQTLRHIVLLILLACSMFVVCQLEKLTAFGLQVHIVEQMGHTVKVKVKLSRNRPWRPIGL
jgi:hypothetical protein